MILMNLIFSCFSVRLHFPLFVGWLMSYLRYLCLFGYSGVQHVLCCGFVLFVFVLCLVYPNVSSFCEFSILDYSIGFL